jgi:hypothetical protein
MRRWPHSQGVSLAVFVVWCGREKEPVGLQSMMTVWVGAGGREGQHVHAERVSLSASGGGSQQARSGLVITCEAAISDLPSPLLLLLLLLQVGCW